MEKALKWCCGTISFKNEAILVHWLASVNNEWLIKMTKSFQTNSKLVQNSTMDHQEPGVNGQDDALIRFSPSSPFVTMRHYISEFDPDESSTYMSMNALKLAESWKKL